MSPLVDPGYSKMFPFASVVTWPELIVNIFLKPPDLYADKTVPFVEGSDEVVPFPETCADFATSTCLNVSPKNILFASEFASTTVSVFKIVVFDTSS